MSMLPAGVVGQTPIIINSRLSMVLSDELVLADAAAASIVWNTADILQLNDVSGITVAFELLTSDSLSYEERLGYGYALVAEDGLLYGETLLGAVQKILTAADILAYGESARATLQWAMALADALVLAETATYATGMSAEDTLTFSSTIQAELKRILTAADTVAYTGQASTYLTLLLSAEDAMEVSEQPDISMLWQLLTSDTVNLFGTILLDGEDYTVWVLNTETLGATTYANYSFNSFAEHGGRFFGLNESGLYELVGDSDDGTDIDAHLRTAMSSHGSRQFKRVVRAYLIYTADERILLKTHTLEHGEHTERWYELGPQPAEHPRAARVKLSRGVTAVHWGFEISNTDGGNLEVQEMQVLPVVLTRRI